MKIVAFSDTHNHHRKIKIPNGDMLIFAGDMSRNGKTMEVVAFLDYVERLPHRYKLVVPGNHDICIENDLSFFANWCKTKGIHLLVNDFIEIECFKIYGTPITPEFGGWAFERNKVQRHQTFQNIPKNTDIIISHGCCRDILDITKTGKRTGCKSLAKNVLRVKPRFFISGHIHESWGVVENDYIKYYNVSCLNEKYELSHDAIEIKV